MSENKVKVDERLLKHLNAQREFFKKEQERTEEIQKEKMAKKDKQIADLETRINQLKSAKNNGVQIKRAQTEFIEWVL